MILPLQEHVLSFGMYLYVTGTFSICMLTYIYVLYIKELYTLQKMISLLPLVHGTISMGESSKNSQY